MPKRSLNFKPVAQISGAAAVVLPVPQWALPKGLAAPVAPFQLGCCSNCLTGYLRVCPAVVTEFS